MKAAQDYLKAENLPLLFANMNDKELEHAMRMLESILACTADNTPAKRAFFDPAERVVARLLSFT